MVREIHPTKQRLIETASELLATHRPDEIQVDQLLAESGISKGSLYHHFEDLADVLEQAQVLRFAQRAESDIAQMAALAHGAKSKDEFFEGMQKVSEAIQKQENRKFRLERVSIIALSRGNERLFSRLSEAQQHMTIALADLVRDAQNKGWFNPELDATAFAVFLQAYTLGRVVDDVAAEPIDPKTWTNLLMRIMAKAAS